MPLSPFAARHRPEVVVYTRASCGLCHRAEALVAREARRATIRHVDVDGDEDLVRRYGVRVPVVVVDGVEVAELEVAPGTVRAAVRAAVRDAAGRGRRGG
ncbi:glutaredoxin family protein [Egicoccus sp. AB-alg2]|uniref:glutaredoxin family protein n=1 Tax=Egicoccus sp. AB-alg2 TaxID=3242693 RepID=UPI00359D3700